MPLAAIAILVLGSFTACTDPPRTEASQPVDLASDERWISLWLQVGEEQDEVGQATDDRLEQACRRALHTLEANEAYLMNVTDQLVRSELNRNLPPLMDFYRHCIEAPRVSSSFQKRFVEVSLAFATVSKRVDDLGVT